MEVVIDRFLKAMTKIVVFVIILAAGYWWAAALTETTLPSWTWDRARGFALWLEGLWGGFERVVGWITAEDATVPSKASDPEYWYLFAMLVVMFLLIYLVFNAFLTFIGGLFAFAAGASAMTGGVAGGSTASPAPSPAPAPAGGGAAGGGGSSGSWTPLSSFLYTQRFPISVIILALAFWMIGDNVYHRATGLWDERNEGQMFAEDVKGQQCVLPEDGKIPFEAVPACVGLSQTSGGVEVADRKRLEWSLGVTCYTYATHPGDTSYVAEVYHDRAKWMASQNPEWCPKGLADNGWSWSGLLSLFRSLVSNAGWAIPAGIIGAWVINSRKEITDAAGNVVAWYSKTGLKTTFLRFALVTVGVLMLLKVSGSLLGVLF